MKKLFVGATALLMFAFTACSGGGAATEEAEDTPAIPESVVEEVEQAAEEIEEEAQSIEEEADAILRELEN